MTRREREWLIDITAVEDAIEQCGPTNVGLRVNDIVKYADLPKNRVLKVLHDAIYNLDEVRVFHSRPDPTDERFKLWSSLCR